MSAPRLSIRVDVDVEHARRVIEARLAIVGGSAQPTTPPGRAALADGVRALRERLRSEVMAAYPEARVVVTMWRKEPKARATKVRLGHRSADAIAERRCALIGEHVDALRAATIEAMRREVAAAPLSAIGGGASLADTPTLPSLLPSLMPSLLLASDAEPPQDQEGAGLPLA